jgi:hypothetical protein
MALENMFRNLQSFVFGNNHKSREGSNTVTPLSTGYEFLTGVVLEYVNSAGITFLRKKFSQDPEYSKKIKNAHILNKIGAGSIVFKITDGGVGLTSDNCYVAFPFFSPHLSIPIKPGEYVWIVKEMDDGIEKYYWLSRKHGIDQVDDTNYTFLERSDTIENKIAEKIKEKSKGKKKQSAVDNPAKEDDEIAELHSFLPGQLEEENFDNPDYYNKNIVNSSTDFIDRFSYEPVPKIAKNPGDTLLQGSNNSFVHLTTEKFRNNLHSNVYGNEPAIDICVGRKKSQMDSISEKQSSTSIAGQVLIESDTESSKIGSVASVQPANSITTYELNKTKHMFEDMNDDLDYYDQDPINCGARLYMSKNCEIDSIFRTDFDVLSSHSGESIATFSNINRVIGRHSTRIVNLSGESFINMDSTGNIVIKSSKDNGQQFLSLINNGVSRLQARDKIQFAVGSDNDSESSSVTEPYILHSELAPLLKKLAGDAAYANFILDTLLQALAKVPPIAAVLGPIIEALNQARDLRDSGALGQSIPFETPATDEFGEAVEGAPPIQSALSLEAAGNNITQDNIFEEAIDVIDNKIKSTKIFGEENDPEN